MIKKSVRYLSSKIVVEKKKKNSKKNLRFLNQKRSITQAVLLCTASVLECCGHWGPYDHGKHFFIEKKKRGRRLGTVFLFPRDSSTLYPSNLVLGLTSRETADLTKKSHDVPEAYNTQQKPLSFGRNVLTRSASFLHMEANGPKKSEVQFRKTVFTHGTSRDKMAAHVLRCMEAPVHSLRNLTILISNVSPKSKDWMEAMDSVRELLQTSLLPEGFVAREFESHSFNSLLPLLIVSREQAEQQIGLWYYEDQLKKSYRTLILQLKLVCSDSIEQNKSRGIRCLLNLLSNHPKQESDTILEALVNKLGDPNRKVASNTMYGLRTLLQRRPQLKVQVVNMVEILLYRTNMKEKAKYYCLCFLKDLIFAKDDYKLAGKLIKLYFGFFKACTKQGEVDTRLMGALLRGINRAFPYAHIEGQELEQQLNTLYKICHIVNFNIATQALQLIYQVIGGGDSASDRFYGLIYRQLLDPAFGSSSGTPSFLNLVFKALVKDESLQRIRAFIKRLLQVGQYQTSHLICGILYLISEVVNEKPQLGSVREAMLKAGLQVEDDEEEFYPDLDCDEDDQQDESRGKGNKTSQQEKGLNTSKNNDESSDENNSEDGDDMESDGEGEDSDDIGNLEKVENKKKLDKKSSEATVSKLVQSSTSGSSWVHRSNVGSTEPQSQYDPYHRNPLYCGADYSPLWELQQLKDHFHPTVAMFATNLLSGKTITYTGDPLQDFTTMRFLDRFVYRNPKKITEQKDSAGGDVLGRRSQYAPRGVRGLQVNSAQFCNLGENQVPEDDLFFHRYFKKYRIEKKKTEDTEDTSSVEDDDFDGYLERMGGLGSDDEDMDDDLDFAASAQATGDDIESDASNEDDMEDLPGGSDEDTDDDGEDDLGLDGEDDGEEPDFDGDMDSDSDKWQTLGELDSDDNEEVSQPKSKKQKKDKNIKKKDTLKDINKKEKKTKGTQQKAMKDDSDEDSDFGAMGSDGESDMEYDEEAIDFSDDEDDDFGPPADKKGKQNKKANKNMLKSQRKNHGGIMGMFASAEDFAHLLEENAEEGSRGITSQALSNKDKAHVKQMNWEVKRDEKLRGVNWGDVKRKQGGHRRGGKGGRGKVSFRGGSQRGFKSRGRGGKH
ncbi:unnamed protein product, partial [Meganyctiphanes norvegica]